MPPKRKARKVWTEREMNWARRLLADIDKMYARVMQDPRSKAAYWNGDDWGSISGVRDADEWTHNEVARLVLCRVTQLAPKGRGRK